MLRLLKYIIPLLLLIILYDCKREEDPTFFVTASVSNSSEGTVTFNSGDYAVGASVTFTANPKEGYTFTNWVNTQTNQTYTNNPLTISVDGNTTLVANFERSAYNINVEISGQGEVQKTLVGGGTDFVHGSNIELTAVPSENHSFFYWNNDPTDTENPKRLVLESDQNLQAKFDFQVARDLVGTWEFQISDPTSKNVTIIQMSIDIFLNVLLTTIINGNIESQIFSKMVAISSTAIVIGDFAVITNIAVESASSVSMNMIPLPENTTGGGEYDEDAIIGVLIPEEPEAQLDLTGTKLQNEPEEYLDLDEQGLIIPPENAVTASSTTQDIGDVFDQSFDQLTEVQSSTISSDTLQTNTVSATSCDLNVALRSGSSNNQTVSVGSSIDEIVYDITTDCTQIIQLVGSTGLPNGISATIEADELKISGTVSGQSSGTFNYVVEIDNHLEQTSSAPFVSATVSRVLTGTISVISESANTSDTSNSSTSSSTTTSGTTDTGTSSSTSTSGTTDTGTSSSTTSCIRSNVNTNLGTITVTSTVNFVSYQLGSESFIINVVNDCSNESIKYHTANLPPGVSLASTAGIPNEKNLTGTVTDQDAGTYNYTITAYLGNDLSSATETLTLFGTIVVNSQSTTSGTTDTGTSSSTTTSGTTDTGTSSSTTTSGTTDTGTSSSTTTSGTTDTGTSSSTTTSGTTDTGTSSSTTSSAETHSINVTASSSSDYTLSGTDRNGSVSGNDPSVTINAGDTINFAVNSPGHPFYVKTAQGTGTDNLASGVSGNGSESGTVSFTPTSAGTYYYQCSLHNGMYGTIIVQ